MRTIVTTILFVVATMALWVASVFLRLALYGGFPEEITEKLYFTALSQALAAIVFVVFALRRHVLCRRA